MHWAAKVACLAMGTFWLCGALANAADGEEVRAMMCAVIASVVYGIAIFTPAP